MPGPSGDEEGRAGAIPASACPQHHGDSGGGKLPAPTVRPMQHAGPQAGTERTAPNHGAVYKGGRAEETTDCGSENKGEFRAGL